ncbi:Putative fatty acyl-CoA reductase CG5065 [Eumeta japonica]|uniref:Fatty acyl-CoA reductase n=1 Tax=Eumeta variegata TaxID=151549 RepID=A0A4C2AAQ1_EUMVA|nr:Putative fatty acyl-CoA reductase CG5065 [Eumeta japonica]
MNIKGTARVLKLAKTMPKLKNRICRFRPHIYGVQQRARSHIEEVVYPPPYDPDSIVKCGQMLPRDGQLDSERIQGDHPNTYTLTKALAESIVVRQKDLPVCIVRPSIDFVILTPPCGKPILWSTLLQPKKRENSTGDKPRSHNTDIKHQLPLLRYSMNHFLPSSVPPPSINLLHFINILMISKVLVMHW